MSRKPNINIYNELNDIVELIIINQKNIEQKVIFDKEHVNIIKQYRWRINSSGYAVSGDKPYIIMHRLILNNPNSDIDHINRNKKDNRISNLRIATKSENMINRIKQKNNTSGFCGVTFDKYKNKWRSQIKINSKHINLGIFNNIEDAIQARKDAEIKYGFDKIKWEKDE